MDEIVAHYQEVREETRLEAGPGLLEKARTQGLILRRLPQPPLTILDVGGGTGVYAAWLTSLGHRVHLVDPVSRHVELARAAGVASASLGDARALPWEDRTADAVLLLGPLYHLTDRNQRLAALREAKRVLRPAGLLFASAICRFASLLDALARGFVDDPEFARILDEDLATGRHRNDTPNLSYFTTAYFHRPDDLIAEIAEAGFSGADVLPVEGPGWLAAEFDKRWADPVRREQLLALIGKTEREPALLGVSPHLLAVASTETDLNKT